jgi:hypothetical protein
VLEKIEPFGERREDYRNAHLIAQLANMLAPRKGRAYQAEEFLLEFKGSEQVTTEQSLQQIEATIVTWVAAANIMHRREKKMGVNSAV